MTAVGAFLASAGCGGGPQAPDPRPGSTFEKIYHEAESGEPASQNVIGFMLFFGEVAPADQALAAHWFRSAAAQGNVSALLNLALMHYFGSGAHQDPEAAEDYFRRAQTEVPVTGDPVARRSLPSTLEGLVAQTCDPVRAPNTVGEETYVMFCAGCHGLNGIPAFVDSPAFALGERLEKSDNELFRTVSGGHDVMPGWGDKLPDHLLLEALTFARSLEVEFRDGVLHRPRRAPNQFFLFGPMTFDSVAYRSRAALSDEEVGGRTDDAFCSGAV
jgi:cytochrome c5